MLVQFGNNWIQKIPLTAKLDSAYGLVQFWLSSEFFSSNYFQIGQHVVLLHIQMPQTVEQAETWEEDYNIYCCKKPVIQSTRGFATAEDETETSI